MYIPLLSYAILSAWVYSPYTKDIPMGMFNPIIVSGRVTLFESDHSCVVAYRGTKSFSDFMDDLRIQINQHCDIESGILRGFLKSFNEIDQSSHDKIRVELKGGRCKHKKIYFTGHSLGAAMALIAPIEYGIDKFERIITFGGPKICCRNYKLPTDKIIRVVNGGDPIPALPEPFEVDQLRHCGPRVVALPTKKEFYDYDWPTLEENHDLIDHGINNYISNLREYITHFRSSKL
jgi:predicted lipase